MTNKEIKSVKNEMELKANKENYGDDSETEQSTTLTDGETFTY